MIARKNHTRTKAYFVQNMGGGKLLGKPLSFVLLHHPLLAHKLGIQSFSIIIKITTNLSLARTHLVRSNE